jgi:DNA-binding transcriptional regulator LsrR (DeoR family)
MNRDLYIKIAFWYHALGMTQDEIAKRLGLTRQKVNQIINSLREQGIVSIHIHGYEQENAEYESMLEERFGLKQVIIAPDYGDPKANMLKVANIAAQYLEKTIQQGDVIGVSWGRTLAAVIKDMEYQSKSECRVVQLVGAQNMDQFLLKADEIVRQMANKLDCPSYILYAPVVVSHEETKQMLLQEKTVQKSFELMRRCNVGLFGIGELTEDAIMCRIGYISDADLEKLRADGFCADLGMNPVRADGSYDNCYLEKRLLNANMECIRDIDNAIGVACGLEKAEAILAVLKSGCLNTLIIDAVTAEKIISMLREEE